MLVAAALLGLLALAPMSATGEELPIPHLARWEAQMLGFGQMQCEFLAQPYTTDELLRHVYYDAHWVFLRIAEYTGTAAWTTCAERAAVIYRDRFVGPHHGRVPGYWNFTTGLLMDYQRTGAATSKDTAVLLSENAAYAGEATPLAWTASADRSREVAYTILSYINAEALGERWRRRRVDLVDQAYDHLDQWFVRFSWPGPWQQSPQTTSRVAPFMVGLTARALILDWDETQDPRLIPALRRAADWMWTHAWIPSAQAMWYESVDTSRGAPDLNLLIAPIYAFLHRHTGEPAYREQGDQLFAGGVTGANLQGGKQFNQNYWWSFDYVTWRGGPVDTVLPAVAISTPPAGSTVGGTILVTASAEDDRAVVGVQVKVDGVNLGAELSVAPYAVTWDSSTIPDGAHTLTAVARDATGNVATSAPVSVTVANDLMPPDVTASAFPVNP
jgi:hypothetical protein